MTKEELKSGLQGLLPALTFEEGGEWLTAEVTPAGYLPTMQVLRNDPLLNFDYLFCQTCVDWKTHLTVVCHLTSTTHRQPLVVKVRLDRNKPDIETISHFWKAAEFYEREVYELFGVNFLHHPDLRLLILPDGWEGRNPLRKDFEDPVNMIKL